MGTERLLSQRGIRLLEDEYIDAIFDKTIGMVQWPVLSDGLILTNQRGIRVGPKNRVRMAVLDDVPYMEIDDQEKKILLLILACPLLVLCIGGIWWVGFFGEGLFSRSLGSMDIPSIKTVLFSFLGVLGMSYLCKWAESGSASVNTEIGGEKVELKISGDALEGSEEFVRRFFSNKIQN